MPSETRSDVPIEYEGVCGSCGDELQVGFDDGFSPVIYCECTNWTTDTYEFPSKWRPEDDPIK